MVQLKYTATYLIAIVLCNVGFVYVPLLTMPGGEKWPPMSLLVGLVFVARDFAQKEIGHRVWFAMLAGCALSYFMASPFVAIASAVAFLTSEAIDWAIYSFTKRPLHERVLWSSLASTPIDSAVFLAIIGHLSVSGVLAMVASKMIAAALIFYWARRRPCLFGEHVDVPETVDRGWIYSWICARCGRRYCNPDSAR